MATVRPFRALRYDPSRVGGLSAVLAPPYDVIDAQEQDQLYARSPHNVVRLILGKQSAADTPTDSRYTRSARDFAAWQGQGILRRDPTPALYLIDHRFQSDGESRSRLGFLALLEFTEPIERAVLRHEKTLDAPKEDRTKLLDAVPASLEPIFLVYPDEGGAIQALLRSCSAAAPDAAGSLGGEEIRLWAVTDPAVIQRVTAALERSAVLIADGHHRFEVAYSRRSRHGALMAYFASMEEPSLIVRPIHRVVSSWRRLEVEALGSLCVAEPVLDLAALTRWLDGERAPGRFGWSDGRVFYRLTVPSDRLERWLQTSPVPKPVARLDVSLLHDLLLPGLGFNSATIRYAADARKVIGELDGGPSTRPNDGGTRPSTSLGIPPAPANRVAEGGPGSEQRESKDSGFRGSTRFARSPQSRARQSRVEERPTPPNRVVGLHESVWLLRGIPLADVYDVAAQGLTLPPKSTYFYPKVPSGLAINPLVPPLA